MSIPCAVLMRSKFAGSGVSADIVGAFRGTTQGAASKPGKSKPAALLAGHKMRVDRLRCSLCAGWRQAEGGGGREREAVTFHDDLLS
jgi:hypothetical protein